MRVTATVYNPYSRDKFYSNVPLLDEDFDSFDELRDIPLNRSSGLAAGPTVVDRL